MRFEPEDGTPIGHFYGCDVWLFIYDDPYMIARFGNGAGDRRMYSVDVLRNTLDGVYGPYETVSNKIGVQAMITALAYIAVSGDVKLLSAITE